MCLVKGVEFTFTNEDFLMLTKKSIFFVYFYVLL